MEYIRYIIAAFGAGIGTGLAGLSAATVMVPILIVLFPSFGGENGAYQATAMLILNYWSVISGIAVVVETMRCLGKFIMYIVPSRCFGIENKACAGERFAWRSAADLGRPVQIQRRDYVKVQSLAETPQRRKYSCGGSQRNLYQIYFGRQ